MADLQDVRRTCFAPEGFHAHPFYAPVFRRVIRHPVSNPIGYNSTIRIDFNTVNNPVAILGITNLHLIKRTNKTIGIRIADTACFKKLYLGGIRIIA